MTHRAHRDFAPTQLDFVHDTEPAEASTEVGSAPPSEREDIGQEFGLVRGLLWSMAITGAAIALAALLAWRLA